MRLLDLFCGAGGAAMGYVRAGFNVAGVDIAPQPNYPLQFHQADALELLADLDWLEDGDFDAIHASPPCQAFTAYRRNGRVGDYPDLIAETRELLRATGLPYVIENVVGAPLENPVRLCGSMFDGKGTNDIQRHRLFETNWPLVAPGKCDHSIWQEVRYPGGRSRERGGPRVLCRKTVEIGRWNIPVETQRWAMGIDWMTLEELSESIPPAYTEYIGNQLAAHIKSAHLLRAA